MTVTARIYDFLGFEVEHLISDTRNAAPLVKVRCLSKEAVLIGQVEPADARQIANHLYECAARAEYESDLWRASKAHGVGDEAIAVVLTLVREGEQRRHEGDA